MRKNAVSFPQFCHVFCFSACLLGAFLCWPLDGALRNALAGESDAEIRDALIEELKEQENLDTVLFLNGSILQGEVEVIEGTVFIKEQFGHSGSLSTSFNRDEIADITFAQPIDPTITSEEIAIKREFPDFHILKREQHTFFTSEDFFFITRIIYALEGLYSEIHEEFDALFQDKQSTQKRCYVIVFSTQDEYKAYTAKYAPALEYSSGHYDFQRSRLVLFDQFGSQDYTGFKEEVRKQETELDKLENRLEKSGKLDTLYKQRMQEKIQGAKRQNKALSTRTALQMKGHNIRLMHHEGTHQLFDAAALHRTSSSRRPWFSEGIACFCETPHVGQINKPRLTVVKEAIRGNWVIPLKELLDNVKQERDLIRLDEGRVELFYAQSWSLIYFFMNTHHRDGFLLFIRKSNQYQRILFWEETQEALLTKALGVGLDELEAEWHHFISTL